MKKLKITLTLIFMLSLFISASAQQWQTPVIEGYGKIKYFDNAAVQPDKNKDYKILFHLTSDKTKEDVNAGLWHVARQINLFGAADVPADNVEIVVVVSGKATPLVMTDEAYRKNYGNSNPNLDLIKKLTDYGVKLEVCGQAAAEHSIDIPGELNDAVVLTLSALIDIPTYQMQGYTVIF